MNRMNSLAAGQKLAMQLVKVQCLASFFAGLALVFAGRWYACAGLLGGLVVAASTYLMASKMLRTLGTSSQVLGRFVMGIAIKWLWIAGMLSMLVIWAKLPPLGVVVGVVFATSSQFFVWMTERQR